MIETNPKDAAREAAYALAVLTRGFDPPSRDHVCGDLLE